MISVTQDAKCLILTIDRADKANSLTAEMLSELIQEIDARPTDIHAVVLTGAGEKVFSAGADLEEARAGLAVSPLWEALSAKIAALPCLSIAALNGTLAGGAFGMALACDLRLAAPHAKFFYPVAKLGFLPQPSDPKRLVRLIGPARAKMILAAAQKITAETALSWGLVEEITNSPLARAREIIGEISTSEPAHIARIKAMV